MRLRFLRSGHHRYRAAIDCGIELVPVMRHLALTDEEKEGHAYFLNTLGRDISKKEKQEAAIRLHAQGKSNPLIGGWLGVSRETVRLWIKQAQTELPTSNNLPVGNVESADGKFRPSVAASAETLTEREETALKLREEGRTLKEIALAIGVSSPQTASNTLARAESKRVELAEPDEEETQITAKPAIDMRIFELIEYAARTAAEVTYTARFACVCP